MKKLRRKPEWQNAGNTGGGAGGRESRPPVSPHPLGKLGQNANGKWVIYYVVAVNKYQ